MIFKFYQTLQKSKRTLPPTLLYSLAAWISMEQQSKQKKKRNLMAGGKFNPWSQDKNKSISFSLRQKSKSLTITMKISSHKNNNNKRHFSSFFFCISSFLNTGIIYSTTPTSLSQPYKVKCVEVSGAGCWTRRPAAGEECCVRSCSRSGACSVRRSECLECAVLSSWWPLQKTRAGWTQPPVRPLRIVGKMSNSIKRSLHTALTANRRAD